jgi:hypothetical protein
MRAGNSAAAELRPRHGGRRGGVLVAEIDPAFRQVVRRHFDRDAIPGENPDSVLLHLARRVGERFMPVVEPHPKPRIGQKLRHGPFEFDQLFLGQ